MIFIGDTQLLKLEYMRQAEFLNIVADSSFLIFAKIMSELRQQKIAIKAQNL